MKKTVPVACLVPPAKSRYPIMLPFPHSLFRDGKEMPTGRVLFLKLTRTPPFVLSQGARSASPQSLTKFPRNQSNAPSSWASLSLSASLQSSPHALCFPARCESPIPFTSLCNNTTSLSLHHLLCARSSLSSSSLFGPPSEFSPFCSFVSIFYFIVFSFYRRSCPSCASSGSFFPPP